MEPRVPRRRTGGVQPAEGLWGDLTVVEVEQWLEDFVSMGTEALRSHPRDAEARHKAEKKELLAKKGRDKGGLR